MKVAVIPRVRRRTPEAIETPPATMAGPAPFEMYGSVHLSSENPGDAQRRPRKALYGNTDSEADHELIDHWTDWQNAHTDRLGRAAIGPGPGVRR